MKTKTLILTVLGLVVLGGCAATTAQRAPSGMVEVSKAFPVGRYAPDIPFVLVDGRESTFYNEKQPIAIVAFVALPADECCELNAELANLAARFSHLPVTVLQVSQPLCPRGVECEAKCVVDSQYLMSVCDAAGITWKGFIDPRPDTVYLIDDNGRIVASDRLGNLDRIAEQAEELGQKAEDIRYEHYAI